MIYLYDKYLYDFFKCLLKFVFKYDRKELT